MITEIHPDRMAPNGFRRCGLAYIDEQPVGDPKMREAIETIVEHQLGPNHPGWTFRELAELKRWRNKRRPMNIKDLERALALRELLPKPPGVAA